MRIRMYLHEAITHVLIENNRPMTSNEIAEEINKRKLYLRKDRKPIKPSQIAARINNHPELFVRENEYIRRTRK
jgi:hypothetical protein